MSAPTGTLRFPEELRLRGSALRRADGRLAHASVADDGLHCTIDGMRAVVSSWSAHGEAHETTSIWPWGLELARKDDTSPTRLVQRVFVAPEHPLVALEWEATDSIEISIEIALEEGLRAIEGDADHVRRTGGSTWALGLVAGEPVRILLVPIVGEEPPLAPLFASAFARARRRAASRPSLIRTRSPAKGAEGAEGADGADVFASLEHAIRAAPDSHVDYGEATRAAIAMLALNDAVPASELLTDPRAGAFHPVLLGALAGWTGGAEALMRSRARYVEWLSSELAALTSTAPPTPGDQEQAIRQTGLAFAPAVVELLGERTLAVALRDVSLPDARDALASLARTAASSSAARAAASVLGHFHHSLGISPDAPRGRVRIGPRLAPGDSLRLDRLRVGEAVFRVHASMADAGLARIRVEQTAGAAPNTLIVEPWLPGTRLRAALVDGATAELDFAQAGDGIRPRVQLAVDHARDIVLHFD